MIDTENWKTKRYKSLDSLAFISLGAIPAPEGDEVIFEYLVTLTNLEYVEIYQINFPTLREAVDFINRRYSQWELIDLSPRGDGDGCSSCHAH